MISVVGSEFDWDEDGFYGGTCLDSWKTGLLDFWNNGWLECWIAGILDCWREKQCSWNAMLPKG